MKTLTTEVLADGFYLLQSPRWHTGHLWMSDVAGGTIYRLAMNGRIDVVAEVPHRPSGLGFLPDGTLLVVSMKNRSLLRLKNGTLSTHCDLSEMATGELNEMFVDSRGRAYVGSFDWSERVPRCFKEARLILVTPDGKPRVVASDFAFPNGCVMTPDQKHLILAETFARRLTMFDISDDGSLSGRRLLADLGKVRPDGICLDKEGGIWVAATQRPLFIRRLGDRITHAVRVPRRQAVACALGGSNGSVLFCLTVSDDFEDVQGWPATARVETTQVEIGVETLRQ
jgi:sugar lactone lactonase YvrE